VKFSALRIGEFFEYRGEAYQKTARNMAELLPARTGVIFQAEMEVQAEQPGEAQAAHNETA
jgi:hypothetical protein